LRSRLTRRFECGNDVVWVGFGLQHGGGGGEGWLRSPGIRFQPGGEEERRTMSNPWFHRLDTSGTVGRARAMEHNSSSGILSALGTYDNVPPG